MPADCSESSFSSTSSATSSLSAASSALASRIRSAGSLITSPLRRLRRKTWAPNQDNVYTSSLRHIRIRSDLCTAIERHFVDFPGVFRPSNEVAGLVDVHFFTSMGPVEVLVPLFEELVHAYDMFPFNRMIEGFEGTYNLTYLIHVAAVCGFSKYLRHKNAYTYEAMQLILGSPMHLELITQRCVRYLRQIPIKLCRMDEFAEEVLDQYRYYS